MTYDLSRIVLAPDIYGSHQGLGRYEVRYRTGTPWRGGAGGPSAPALHRVCATNDECQTWLRSLEG